jgi:hypothetical protein
MAVGGALADTTIVRRFIELAGGPDAPIVVIGVEARGLVVEGPGVLLVRNDMQLDAAYIEWYPYDDNPSPS